jgi:hypothetical protein
MELSEGKQMCPYKGNTLAELTDILDFFLLTPPLKV